MKQKLFSMTLTELLASVRRVEVRTNRLVNAVASKPLEIESFGNCGEFAIIKPIKFKETRTSNN